MCGKAVPPGKYLSPFYGPRAEWSGKGLNRDQRPSFVSLIMAEKSLMADSTWLGVKNSLLSIIADIG